jgi:hypothetical protein
MGDVDPILLHRYYGAVKNPTSGHEPTVANHNQPSSPDYPSSDSDSESTSSSTGSSSDTYADSSSNPESDSDPDSNSNSGFESESGSESSDDPHDQGSNGDAMEGFSERSWQEIFSVITQQQRHNVRHAAAKVARSAMPFETEDDGHAFALALDSALNSHQYPAGFGLEEEYESLESYRTGRSSKALVIPLPHEVWFPRIIVWCKAVDLLKRLPVCKASVTP